MNKNTYLKLAYFLPLFLFGVMHFTHASYFLFMVPDIAPGNYFWVYFSGFSLCSASTAIIFNFYPKTACVCLIIFVIIFIVSVDIPGIIDTVSPYRYVISLLKDISLGAGTYLVMKKLV